jgi:AraC-like DNA-binding protein/copper chaperone CopZ
MKLFIKNMACESCKIVVKEELEKLGLHPRKVELGEADVKEKVTAEKQHKFNAAIKKAGLEVIHSKEGILLEKIKKEIIEYVYQADEKIPGNFSRYISKNLGYSYTYLSTFFSAMQATTIEQFMIALKIERAKELVLFKEKTLTEIAYQLNYSSVAHLSSQFKKVTGLTPSHFKKLKKARRTVIQKL